MVTVLVVHDLPLLASLMSITQAVCESLVSYPVIVHPTSSHKDIAPAIVLYSTVSAYREVLLQHLSEVVVP